LVKAISTFRLWVVVALLAAAPLLFAQSASAHSGHQHHSSEISFSADDFAALASMAEQAEAATSASRDGARQAEQRLEPNAAGDQTAACHHACCSAAAGCCAASCLAVETVHAGFFGNSCCFPVGTILPTDGVEPSGLSEPPNGSA
jgi:hypothetical protein